MAALAFEAEMPEPGAFFGGERYLEGRLSRVDMATAAALRAMVK